MHASPAGFAGRLAMSVMARKWCKFGHRRAHRQLEILSRKGKERSWPVAVQYGS